MITLTANHLALLATRSFAVVDLYQITLLDGTILRLTNGALTTSWNGYTWQCGPQIARDSVRLTRGLDVDEMKIVVTPRDDDTLLGIGWRDAVSNGALNGASVSLYRGHAKTPYSPIVGAILRFAGVVGVPVVGVMEIEIPVKSKLTVLSRQLPRGVYQSECDRQIFDDACTLKRATYQVAASLLSGSTASVLQTGLSGDAGTYTKGEVYFTGGINAGARRTVKTHAAGGVLTLSYPLPRSVAAGDTFVIWPGCDGTYANCTKHSNQIHFTGKPLIPSPETAA